MVKELKMHLERKAMLSYTVDQITLEELQEVWLAPRRTSYGTIEGTQTFQVVVFNPRADKIKAAPRICLCATCKVKYGTCPLFKEYQIPLTHLKNTSLRSDRIPATVPEETTASPTESSLMDCIHSDTVCAIAPEESSLDPVWFIKIDNVHMDIEEDFIDNYKHVVKKAATALKADISNIMGQQIKQK